MMDKDIAIKKVAKGAVYIFVGMFIANIFSYAIKIILARYLGPADYGLLSLALSIFIILTGIGLFGLDVSIMRYVSYYRGKKDKTKVKSSIFSVIKMLTVTSLILAGLLFLFSDKISILFFNKPELSFLLKIFSICIPFSIFTTVFVSILSGFHKVKYKALIEYAGKNIFLFISLVIFLFFGYKLTGVLYSYLISYLLIFSISTITIISILNKYLDKKLKTIPMSKEILLFSWPLLLMMTVSTMLAWSSNIFLGIFLESSDIGIYNAALTTGMLLNIVFISVGYIFLPVASELFSRSKTKFISLFRTASRWQFSLMLPLFMFVMFFSEGIINIMFGKEYASASLPLVILAFGYLVSSLMGSTGGTLVSIGKTKQSLAAILIGAAINIILNLTLIPLYGIVGAAIATAASLIVLSTVSELFIFLNIGSVAFSKKHLRILLSAILAIVSYYILINSIPVSSTIRILMFPIFFIIYFILYIVTKNLSKNDIIILKSIEKKFGLNIKFVRKIIKKFT